jgi:hypothetical protein
MSMVWHWLNWTGIVAVWATFGYQLRSMFRVRRQAKVGLAQIAHEAEVTPLQVQVAMDAAAAVFTTRIEEMRRADRARS